MLTSSRASLLAPDRSRRSTVCAAICALAAARWSGVCLSCECEADTCQESTGYPINSATRWWQQPSVAFFNSRKSPAFLQQRTSSRTACRLSHLNLPQPCSESTYAAGKHGVLLTSSSASLTTPARMSTPTVAVRPMEAAMCSGLWRNCTEIDRGDEPTAFIRFYFPIPVTDSNRNKVTSSAGRSTLGSSLRLTFVVASLQAPFCRRSSTTAVRPFRAAEWSGVWAYCSGKATEVSKAGTTPE